MMRRPTFVPERRACRSVAKNQQELRSNSWEVGRWANFCSKEEDRMEITDVRVRKIAKEGKMKAIVSITFDNEFVVHDIKVIEGEKGLFIAMPSKKASDGEYRDIAHPINSNTRDRIQSTILESYEKALLEPELAY